MPHHTHVTSAADLRSRLGVLEAEEAEALEAGLLDNPAYAADLRREVDATRAAYVGAAVTEIASLRAALDGPLLG